MKKPDPYPRPRMKIRNKKRRHPTWRMTPEERELWYFINEELFKLYTEELNKAILWGDGGEIVGCRTMQGLR